MMPPHRGGKQRRVLYCPSVLIVTTQTWLQVARLAMCLGSYGARVSAICPEDSPLRHASCLNERFRFRLSNPLGSLRHAIAASNAEYLLPADDMAVALLHELAAITPALRPLLERSLGHMAAYPILRSRFQLLALAHGMGISVPKTELISCAGDFERWCSSHYESFVLKTVPGVDEACSWCIRGRKPKTLSAVSGCRRRSASASRSGDGSAFARLHAAPPAEITAQSFVRGVPANSMYACHKGRVLGEVQARVAASQGETGPSLVIQIIQSSRIHASRARARCWPSA